MEALRDWEAGDEQEITRGVRQGIDYFANYHSANPALEFHGSQSAQAPTLETIAGASKELAAQANARVDIYLRQAGRDMGIARPLLSQIPVLGSSRNVRAHGTTRIITEIYQKGAPSPSSRNTPRASANGSSPTPSSPSTR